LNKQEIESKHKDVDGICDSVTLSNTHLINRLLSFLQPYLSSTHLNRCEA